MTGYYSFKFRFSLILKDKTQSGDLQLSWKFQLKGINKHLSAAQDSGDAVSSYLSSLIIQSDLLVISTDPENHKKMKTVPLSLASSTKIISDKRW